ncbi:branched-chain amino acid ABC transporter permease [Aurantimonas sp. VKM B-3413]|uniref:branched-chain amino acid ABC transporter permease n=1 Tax=Aurantimonas sp. VKM B-3413 TaxID=2779401 RepID=UPI001E3AEC15|nr:branched-chain amino acid ABC transporter permease [Aurantimonas sp. VKM B-3413]MCB8839810.1 branched-chain amino acid ABC transporter permease [Aurantimonas sp. VKM B-3413]
MTIADTGPAEAGSAQSFLAAIDGRYLLAATLLILYPLVASNFFIFQIGAWALILGLIALSLMVLAGYGGMVSLAQLTVAGIAAYCVAIFGTNESNLLGLGWPWWLVVPVSVLLAALASTLIGLLAVRTEGIYTIMITLAIGTAFFYFVRQNYDVFNGFNGFHGVLPPHAFGVNWRAPVPFYYLCLAVSGLFFAGTVYAERSTFGLTLQAIRDNPRRMRALGYNVAAHRVFAFFLSGIMAGSAGVLLVWFNAQISPGTIGVDAAIDVLVVAVVGGIASPVGPFLGAILFVLLENFAIDLVASDRFNTVIGLVFLIVLFVSPKGLLGILAKMREAGSGTSSGSGRSRGT